MVLSGLKTESGKEFVEVYIDDVLIFSETLEEHLEHIRLVLERLKKAGLKLKPSKCHFLRESVEYLGHLITPQGLKPNPEQVKAVVLLSGLLVFLVWWKQNQSRWSTLVVRETAISEVCRARGRDCVG